MGQNLSLKDGPKATAEAYAKVTYDEGDKTNKSVKCYGVVGVPMQLIHRVQHMEDDDLVKSLKFRRMKPEHRKYENDPQKDSADG